MTMSTEYLSRHDPGGHALRAAVLVPSTARRSVRAEEWLALVALLVLVVGLAQVALR